MECSVVEVCEIGCKGHDVGDVVTPKLHLVDPKTGEPADATAVTLSIRLPDGTVITPPVVHDDVGEYHADYVPEVPGQFFFKYVATGTVQAAEQGAFLVRSMFA